MPSTDPNKYILHPLEPLTVPEALLTAFCGLLVVFMMLAMLMVVIYVISWVVQQIESKRKPVAAPAKAAPKPAAPKPAAAPAAPAQDESELVAVMMAAVAEESGMPMGSFQITNIAPAAAPVAAPAPVAAAPAAAPAPVAAPAAAAPAAGETAVKSPMPGNIFKVECSVGQAVNAGDVLVVLEAMKMEIEVSAPVAGTVKAVAASVGTAVNTDDLLVTIG